MPLGNKRRRASERGRGEGQREREGTLARFTLLSVSRFAGGHSLERDLRSMFRISEAHRSTSL